MKTNIAIKEYNPKLVVLGALFNGYKVVNKKGCYYWIDLCSNPLHFKTSLQMRENIYGFRYRSRNI